MRTRNLIAAICVIAATNLANAQAPVIINEVLADPAGSLPTDLAGDANRDGARDAARDEFVEILNISGSPVDISGWGIGDVQTTFSTCFKFPSGVILPAGGCAILFGGGTPTGFGAFTFTDDGTIGNGLGNGGETVTLYNNSGAVQDTLTCTSSGATGCAADTSLTRIPEGTLGTPTKHNTVSSAIFSPGANIGGLVCEMASPPPPPLGQQFQAGELVITEIMQNPNLVSDANGEWFEIMNASGRVVDLYGLVVKDDGIDRFTVNSSVIVDICGYAIFARVADPGVNGGVVGVSYEYGTLMALANADDELVLLSGVIEVDRVNYDGGATFPDPTGASMKLFCATDDNNIGSSWGESTSPIGGVGGNDLGTPGLPNGVIDLVCNDVVASTAAGTCDANVSFAIGGTDSCGDPITGVVCDRDSGSSFPIGQTVVCCSVTDANCATASCCITLTVEDHENPTAICPPSVNVDNDSGECGAYVAFSPSVDDNCPGARIDCAPASGSLFPVGSTQVCCTATDAAGNEDNCCFDVTVNDTEEPVANCPGNVITDSESGQCGATVTFNPTVDDNCPGASIDCAPASGSFFAVGSTQVSCEATDAAGNTSQCSFDVTVNDNERPIALCPPSVLTDNSPGECGVILSYFASVDDNCPNAQIDCFPASGSFFVVGLTQVCCTAIDASGNQDVCCFDITVLDAENPVAGCPSDLVVPNDPDQCGATVFFDATADDNCPASRIECMPASGEFFVVGVTQVCCTATDAAGNEDQCCFNVTVEDDAAPVVQCNGHDIEPLSIGRPRGGSGSADDRSAARSRGESPVCIVATANDNCQVASIVVLSAYCSQPGASGSAEVDCDIEVNGDTICIYKSGPAGTLIEWTVEATDTSGNVTVETCSINVVAPAGSGSGRARPRVRIGR